MVRSFFGRAEPRCHFIDVDKSVAASVYFFHQILNLFVRHLRTHVGHELFELRNRNTIIFITIQVLQLFDHVLRCVFIFQLVLHYKLEICISDSPSVLRINISLHLR